MASTRRTRADDRKPNDVLPGSAGPPAATVRPAGFFRAVVLGAVAACAPAAGCYESQPDRDAAGDGGYADEASDRAEAEDVVLPPYGAPVYSAPIDAATRDDAIMPHYGMPEYGSP
jgi:hypothetical protein